MNVKTLIGEEAKKNFYPTPFPLAIKLTEGIDFREIHSILEPSAGKGDLAKYTIISAENEYYRHLSMEKPLNMNTLKFYDLDCIEIDPTLRNLLAGQGYRVVHDDFLTYETQKRYDLIIMNPPFDKGAAHLLHAIDLMRNGGYVRCVLNAETIRNPFSNTRKLLLKTLDEIGAEIEFLTGAFYEAERSTDVEIAVIKIEIPRKVIDSSIMDEMRKAPTYKTPAISDDVSELVRYNQIDEWVNRFNFEIACGIRLIEEWQALKPHMLNDPGSNYAKPIIDIVFNMTNERSMSDINSYIQATRLKYWRLLFQQDTITNRLTSNLIEELQNSVNKLVEYDFSVYNILTLILKMNTRVVNGVESTIIKLFDEWTARSYYEDSPNRHYFDGWVTNGCYRVNKKVIIPFYDAWHPYDKCFQSFKVISRMRDIEKVFDFLDSGRTTWEGSITSAFDEAEKTGNTKNIDTKYFTVTFYKKRTAHFVFKDMDLLEKFNLFASQKKGWLPPTYGKKRYKDMTEEEQHVIDSFQGREKYEEIMAKADYYLNTNAATPLMLMGTTQEGDSI